MTTNKSKNTILIVVAMAILWTGNLVQGAETNLLWQAGFFGYNDQIRLCQDAREFLWLYLLPGASAEKETLKVELSLPRGVSYVDYITDKSTLFPPWAIRLKPEISIKKHASGELITFTLESVEIKKGQRFGLGFIVKTNRGDGTGRIRIRLLNESADSPQVQKDYTVRFLPPIQGRRPKRAVVSISHYANRTDQPLVQEIMAENLINAGFTDVLLLHATDYRKDAEMMMLKKAGLRFIANVSIVDIFKDFPFDKYPNAQWADKEGKHHKRRKEVDLQAIVSRHPAVIARLQDYIDHLLNELNYDAVQFDVEGGIMAGCTPAGMEAFRKWCGYSDQTKLDAATIQRDMQDQWIMFRNYQAGETLRTIGQLIRKDHPQTPYGTYGGPSVISYLKDRFKSTYYNTWVFLRDVLNYGMAGYDFPLMDMHDSWCKLGKEKPFYPSYMIIENFYDWRRKYRDIDTVIIRNMIACGGMKGYMIWFSPNVNNGTLYDISQVNDMLTDFEPFFFEGRRQPTELLMVDPPLPSPGDNEYFKSVYSIGDQHVAVIANQAPKPYTFRLFWGGTDRQPDQTKIRQADGTVTEISSKQAVTVPAYSFVVLTTSYPVVRSVGQSGDLFVEDFELCKEGKGFSGQANAQFIVRDRSDDNVLEAVSEGPSENIYLIKQGNLYFGSPLKDYSIRAKVSVDTSENSFGKVGISVRNHDKQAVFAGVNYSKGICWMRGMDTEGKGTPASYLRHARGGKFDFIVELTVQGQEVTCRVDRKTIAFKTNVINTGPPALVIEAVNAGKCTFDNIVIRRIEDQKKRPAKKKSIVPKV